MFIACVAQQKQRGSFNLGRKWLETSPAAILPEENYELSWFDEKHVTRDSAVDSRKGFVSLALVKVTRIKFNLRQGREDMWDLRLDVTRSGQKIIVYLRARNRETRDAWFQTLKYISHVATTRHEIQAEVVE